MSVDSVGFHRFMDEVVKDGLLSFAMKEPYFGAGIVAGAIEFLGNCLDNDPISAENKSAVRFCRAINELFPAEYHQFSRVPPYTKNEKPQHDLYSFLRCGMAHVLRPQGVMLTGTIAEAKEDGHKHLQLLVHGGKEYPLIVVEQFVADFRMAASELQKRVSAAPLSPKLSADFLNVWSV